MKNKDVEIKDEGLSVEVLDKIAIGARENSCKDTKTFFRAMLNGLVELIDVTKDVEYSLEALNQTLIIVNQKEVFDYYTTLSKNIKEEEKRAKTMEIIEQSHKRKKIR